MQRYRCKHAVEAMRWSATGIWIGRGTVKHARWPWLGDVQFLVLDDEQFRETYEEVK